MGGMARGVVKFWKAEKGWGAVASDELPPGRDAWVHFSVIDASGFKTLTAGDPVEFDYLAVAQDSFDYRVTYLRTL